MTPGFKLLLGSCGLWIIYYGIERLRHDGRLGRHVYNMLLIPCLLTSVFLILCTLNLVLDRVLQASK